MPRQPLPIGTWGQIRTQVVNIDDKGKAISHRAQAKYRDHDGLTRLVSAFGKSKTAAENNLRQKLQARAKTGRTGELTAMHKFLAGRRNLGDEVQGSGRRRATVAHLA